MVSFIKNTKGYFRTSLIIMLFVLVAFPCFAKDIQIQLDGKQLTTSVAPVQAKGTTLVPLRIISENLGAIVDYNKTSQQITIQKESKTIILTLGKSKALVNNSEKSLTLAPTLLQSTTMVPLRFVSENLDCSVNWNDDQQLITITSKNTKPSSLPIATLIIKDYGTVTLELYPNMAPKTVENFITLANSGFYDGLIFHRIIADFMIQGGDPLGLGTGGPGYTIPGEFASNGFKANTLSHTKGIISMARSADPNSAGSQFFITSANATFLDGEYAAFGKVILGIEVIDNVQSVKTDSLDHPLQDVVIQSIRVSK